MQFFDIKWRTLRYTCFLSGLKKDLPKSFCPKKVHQKICNPKKAHIANFKPKKSLVLVPHWGK